MISPPDREALRAVRLVAFDFDGVFTDNAVYVFEDGREAVRCTRADGLGLARLKRLGVELVVLSTEKNPVVGHRCRKLGLACRQGLDDKLAVLEEILAARGLSLAQAAYLGNDLNDRDCLAAVGVPVLVADAHPAVRRLARLVTTRPGGHGAVREFCDLLAEVLEEGGTALA
ncbi:MAG: HAD hydrolase family protein [Deltaproteobacteria bacterium]|nr:HAD hydrolase family protein [Deltaproteobacteria bacterium]